MFISLENPRIREVGHAMQFHYWLHVLACPRIYFKMTRKPTREHLLNLIDGYLPYARSTREKAEEQGYRCAGVDEVLRPKLADELRELFERWEPDDLTPEITDTARKLLEAEGQMPPPTGSWDDVPDPDMPPEEFLLWPEGVPLLLKEEAQKK